MFTVFHINLIILKIIIMKKGVLLFFTCLFLFSGSPSGAQNSFLNINFAEYSLLRGVPFSVEEFSVEVIIEIEIVSVRQEPQMIGNKPINFLSITEPNLLNKNKLHIKNLNEWILQDAVVKQYDFYSRPVTSLGSWTFNIGPAVNRLYLSPDNPAGIITIR